jgi:hypothetical protein
MTATTKTDVFDPEILMDAISTGLAGMVALSGSPVAVVNTSMPSTKGGSTITVPYFANMGELTDVGDDDVALTPTALTMDDETATVEHSGKAFEITAWAQMQAAFADPYAEAARQVVSMVERRIDKGLIAAAKSSLSASMISDVFSETAPRKIDYDAVVDGKMLWGDEGQDVEMMAVHSKVFGDLLKLKSADGIPLVVQPEDGSLPRFCGMPVKVSDRLTPTYGAGSSTGTTPPVVSLSGTPTGVFNFVIKITTLGARGTAVFKWSSDGGASYTSGVTTAATNVLGSTGITAAFATGTDYAVDNIYSFRPKFATLLLKRGALVAWTNGTPSIKTWDDVLKDNTVAAIHVYWVAYRYRVLPGMSKGGVVEIIHN